MMPPENPMLGGKLWASNDPGSIPYAMSMGYIVITVVDVGESKNFPNTVTISSLLPPPQAITEVINGEPQKAFNIYMAYLASPERDETIATILAAMYQKPVNYLLYTEYDSDQEFNILNTLAQFFARKFGIIIGHFNDTTNFPPAHNLGDYPYVCTVIDTIFCNGYMSLHDYARLFPHGPHVPVQYTLPTMQACAMILRGINYGFNSPQDCMRACLGMLDDIRNEEKTGKINPMMATPTLSKDALEQLRQRRVDNKVMQETSKQNG